MNNDAPPLFHPPPAMTDLVLALDVPELGEALALAAPLRDRLRWVKVGLQLFTRHGPDAVRAFADLGFKVFLDLKLHDIPNTVASAIKGLRGSPCSLLTIHTTGGPEMIRAAVATAAETLPAATVLGVTVLTSLDAAQLAATGVPRAPEEQVRLLARAGAAAGLRGFVCSPQELALLRGELGAEPLLVAPGVRPGGAAADDQKRAMTPAEAAAHGASLIVVGRPILRAPDRAAAVDAILRELAGSDDAIQTSPFWH